MLLWLAQWPPMMQSSLLVCGGGVTVQVKEAKCNDDGCYYLSDKGHCGAHPAPKRGVMKELRTPISSLLMTPFVLCTETRYETVPRAAGLFPRRDSGRLEQVAGHGTRERTRPGKATRSLQSAGGLALPRSIEIHGGGEGTGMVQPWVES